MEKQNIDLKSPELKKVVDKIVSKAKSKNIIKPLSLAFEEVPAEKEIHKGEIKTFL